MKHTYQEILDSYLECNGFYAKNNNRTMFLEFVIRDGEIYVNFPWTILWVNTEETSLKDLEIKILRDFSIGFNKVEFFTTIINPLCF